MYQTPAFIRKAAYKVIDATASVFSAFRSNGANDEV